MKIFHSRSIASLVLALAVALTASAQITGGGTTGGGTTGGTTGGGTTGGTTGGTSGTGTGAMTPGQGADPDAVFTEVQRGEAVGSTANTGQGFSELSVGTATGGLRGGAVGGMGGLGGGLSALGNLFGGGFGAGTTESAKPVIRTRLRSAVNVPPTAPAQVEFNASQRFRYLTTQSSLRGINVTMQGRTAVISGLVNSERDRRMSELLMRLEPGVSSVDNQIVVAP